MKRRSPLQSIATTAALRQTANRAWHGEAGRSAIAGKCGGEAASPQVAARTFSARSRKLSRRSGIKSRTASTAEVLHNRRHLVLRPAVIVNIAALGGPPRVDAAVQTTRAGPRKPMGLISLKA